MLVRERVAMGKRTVILGCGIFFAAMSCFASDHQGKALELIDGRSVSYHELEEADGKMSSISSQPKAEKASFCTCCSSKKCSDSCCGECLFPALLFSLDKLIILGFF